MTSFFISILFIFEFQFDRIELSNNKEGLLCLKN